MKAQFRVFALACFTLWLLGGGVPLHAQPGGSPSPSNAALFDSMDWPASTVYRSASGRPGPQYWTQRVDYDLAATLDTSAHRIEGKGTITYTNRSPDSLFVLWLNLDQNAYREGSRNSFLHPKDDEEYHYAFPKGGIEIGEVALVQQGETHPVSHSVHGTRMRVRPPSPVAPNGGTIKLRLTWSFTISPENVDRTGRMRTPYGWKYFVAQWYPSLSVYDDVQGWHTEPYLGPGNFYRDYGTFDVEITAPRSVTVAATGTLQNPDEVLTETQQQRLERARTSTEPVSVIEASDVNAATTHPEGNGPLTWHFRAENVRDFAWGGSGGFMWDAATTDRGVLVMSYYTPNNRSDEGERVGWEQATAVGRRAISFFSDWIYPYPYPVAINLSGTNSGMEYPMIQFSGGDFRGQELLGLIEHELAHMWFPMVVGTNEREHGWMDEGFASFMEYRAYVNRKGQDTGEYYAIEPVTRELTRKHHSQPIVSDVQVLRPLHAMSEDLRAEGYSEHSLLGYSKPSLGLRLLRFVILGPDRFDEALRSFVRTWKYGHPRPVDFFRTVETVTGEDLSWFWRGWYYGTGVIDQAVAAVESDTSGTHLILRNPGDLVMPVELELAFSDGTTERRSLPVDVWRYGDRYRLPLRLDRRLTRVRVDPDDELPDVNRTNNTWAASDSE